MSVPNPKPPLPSDGATGFDPDYISPSRTPGPGYPYSGDQPDYTQGPPTNTAGDYPPGQSVYDPQRGRLVSLDEYNTNHPTAMITPVMAEAMPPDMVPVSGILADMMPALNTVAQTSQGLADQITGQCTSCMQTVAQAQQSIVNKILSRLSKLTQCQNNCISSLGQSLSSEGSAAIEQANVATSAAQRPVTSNLDAALEFAEQFITGSSPSSESMPAPTDITIDLPTAPPPVYTPGIGIPVPPPLIPPINIPIPNINLPGATCPIPPPVCTRWNGFCRKKDGVVIALPEGIKPPGPDWIQESTAFDAETAIALASISCTPKEPKPRPLIFLPTIPQPSWTTPNCDLDKYSVTGRLHDIFPPNLADIAGTAIAEQVKISTEAVFAGLERLPLVGALVGIAKGQYDAPFRHSLIVNPVLARLVGCDTGPFVNAANMLSVIGFWSKHSGVDLSRFLRQYDYGMAALCRQRFLEPDKAIAAYLANSINFEQLDTHWAIEGYCPEALRLYVQAARSKPVPQELALMRMRKIIEPTDYHAGMRELGYIQPDAAEKLFSLHYELPPVQDIIRFMVRDADDDSIVEGLGMDDLFEHKFGPQLKEWAAKRGIPDKMMQYEWRSHWTIPGPTQLFQFWHRLRRKPEFGTPEQQRADIEKALIHNDILPHWFKHFFAVQYNPIPFRLLRQAYDVGVIKDDELEDRITEVGYSDENAEKLHEFYRKDKARAAHHTEPIRLWHTFAIDGVKCVDMLSDMGYAAEDIKQAMEFAESEFAGSAYAKAFAAGELDKDAMAGELTSHGVSQEGAQRLARLLGYSVRNHPVVDQYQHGTISFDDANTQLRDYGMADSRIAFLLDRIDAKIFAGRAAVCAKSIRRRYILGELTDDDAREKLLAQGITLERANILVDTWDCESSSLGKHIPAAKLCEWVATGVITQPDYLDRLQRIGYSKDDAIQMLTDCLQMINDKMARKAAKDAKDAAAAAQRAANAQKRTAAEAERIRLKTEQARKAAAAAKLRRDKQLLSAAGAMQKKCECDVATAMNTVMGAKAEVISTYGLTEDEALAALTNAAAKWSKGPPDSFVALVDAEASLIARANEPDYPIGGSLIESTNGETQPSEPTHPLR